VYYLSVREIMNIWICIPVFNRIDFTERCLDSLKAQTYKNFTVVVCDHGSSDGSSTLIKKIFPEVVLINGDSNLWWTGAINLCVSYVLENAVYDDCLLTLNNDTVVPPEYLAEIAAQKVIYPNAVLTSVILDITNGKHVAAGYRQSWLTARITPVSFDQDHLQGDENVIEVTHASGRGTLFPLKIFHQLGLYDEIHFPHYGADENFSQKARRAGYPILVCKRCRIFAHVDATGMAKVRNQFSVNSFIDYLTSIRSPANLAVHWWYGWYNCPRLLFSSFIVLDILRTIGSYFKYFLYKKNFNRGL
jgi:GT2 family glycosyltransferase